MSFVLFLHAIYLPLMVPFSLSLLTKPPIVFSLLLARHATPPHLSSRCALIFLVGVTDIVRVCPEP